MFLASLLLLPPPTSPNQKPLISVAPLYITRYPPPLLTWGAVQLDIAHTHNPPASATRLCAPRRVRASATVSHVHLPLPLRPLAFNQIPVVPWGVCPMSGHLASVCLHRPLPVCWAAYRHIMVLGISIRCSFSLKEEGPGRLHSLETT